MTSDTWHVTCDTWCVTFFSQKFSLSGMLFLFLLWLGHFLGGGLTKSKTFVALFSSLVVNTFLKKCGFKQVLQSRGGLVGRTTTPKLWVGVKPMVEKDVYRVYAKRMFFQKLRIKTVLRYSKPIFLLCWIFFWKVTKFSDFLKINLQPKKYYFAFKNVCPTE